MEKLLVYNSYDRNSFLSYIRFCLYVSHLLCNCRGGTKNEKCPVAIADLVLLYNAAQEGLYGPVKLIAVHLTCLLYVRAQKMVLSNFVKLTSNAFALTCMIFA